MNVEPATLLPATRWPKRHTLVALSFAAVFICYLDRVNISIVALPMQHAFHWSETVKGFVLSSFFIGYLFFQAPSGVLANRFGGRRVLGFAVAWWSLFTLLTPLAATISLPVLLAARIGMGLGEGAAFPAAYNLFARWIPQDERSRSVACLLSGVSLGTLFALSVSGWIIARFSWPAVFYLFGALGLIWAVVWFACIPEDAPARAEESSLPRTIPWKRLFSHRAIWALVVNHFCSNWTLYLLLAWLPSYFANVQHLSLTRAGLFSAAPWLTLFVMINVVAWVADGLIRRGVSITFVRKTMQSIGLIGSALFLFMAKDAPDANAALVLLCGACAAHAFTWSGFVVNHLDIAPRYADVLMGITNTVGSIPGVIGVALTGWLVDTSGNYASAFALAAGLNIFGALVWLAFATGKRIVD